MSLDVDMAPISTDLIFFYFPRVSQVEHVLLYDFPRDPIEYMRRVGRTARAGRKGVVTILAWGRQVSSVSSKSLSRLVRLRFELPLKRPED